MAKSWGKIMLGARLEKMVEAPFVRSWSQLLTAGLRDGDSWELTEGMTAHSAANTLARKLLESDCDTLLIVDSDGDFDKNFIHEMRDHEIGWDYDVLQAFYIRRGWPPEAIWFKRDAFGILHNCMIFGDTTEEVALVGTHCVLVRREVFEKMAEGHDVNKYDWFYYPRHEKTTEDAAFSADAIAAGFKIGATSHVKVNHISHLSVGWETYQEYLQTSGKVEQIAHFDELSELVSKFTGETVDEVGAKMSRGNANVKEAWEEVKPSTPDDVALFYGRNEYLYDLMSWNCSMPYMVITRQLEDYRERDALVVGAGLGTEAKMLSGNNKVDVFELPGALRDFCRLRLNGSVTYLEGDTIPEAVNKKYNLIVAVDTIEHFHPEQFDGIMESLNDALLPGGELYCHNSFGEQETYPMRFDHKAKFTEWAEAHNIKQVSDYVWKKE